MQAAAEISMSRASFLTAISKLMMFFKLQEANIFLNIGLICSIDLNLPFQAQLACWI